MKGSSFSSTMGTEQELYMSFLKHIFESADKIQLTD